MYYIAAIDIVTSLHPMYNISSTQYSLHAKMSSIHLSVLIKLGLVTDRQTDTDTDTGP